MNLDDENLSKLTTVMTEYEATAIVSALEAEGIRAKAVGTYTTGFKAEAPGGASVLVLETDLPRAQQILAELRKHGAGIDWSKVDVDAPDADESAGD
jgi:hypothetical protein